MADEPTPTETEDAAPVLPPQLASDKFDVADWLGDISYAGKKVEVFKQGQDLAEMAELLDFVAQQKEEQKNQLRNLTKPLAPAALTDAPETTDIDVTIRQAQEQADAILERLKGTGLIIELVGIPTEERKVLDESVARSFKPSPAKYEDIDDERVEVRAAEQGGRYHSKFGKAMEHELIAHSIKRVVAPNGAVDDRPWDADRVRDQLDGKLLGPEYRRIANAAYEVNYLNYDIDSKVTLDFS